MLPGRGGTRRIWCQPHTVWVEEQCSGQADWTGQSSAGQRGCTSLERIERSLSRLKHKNTQSGEFPGGPVVRIQCFHCEGLGSIPGQGTKILQDAWRGQKKKKKVGSMRHEQDLMMKGVLKVWTLIFRARETWTQPDLALRSVPATRTLRVTDRQRRMGMAG